MIARKAFRLAGIGVGLLLLLGVVAPYITADRFGDRLQGSLQRALGRRVDLKAKVRFSLLHGPAFRVDPGDGSSGVVIHEDPSLGIEPVAYVGALEVRPSLWHLLFGKFVIASIRLEDASINLTKSGPASEWGRWNFASIVNPAVMHELPAIHVRNGRINFKFGDDKSGFYLTEADFDISPPGAIGRGWDVSVSAKPARTDRAALGLGSFTLKGRWYVAPESVDLNLELADTGLDELTALLRGQAGGIHGTVSSRFHLAGPVNRIGIQGRLNIEDVHRWDLLPSNSGGWPLDIRGQLDLLHQVLELQSNSARAVPLPLFVRFRASDYLSRPRWAVAVNWNRFPCDPLMQLARDMGAQLPPKLRLGGTVDGAIGYSGEGSFQGTLGFHNAAVTIPDSPPVRFADAYLVMDHGHVRLSPAEVRSGDEDRAEIDADYAIDGGTLDLSIVTDSMKVSSLRAQVALAAVPWLEQLKTGEWSGQLHYHLGRAQAGWTGDLQVKDAQIDVPGFADPVQLSSAQAHIDGVNLALDRMEAQAGKMAFTGRYQYDAAAARPHRINLQADALDAADIEAEFLPALRRNTSLIARALRRATLPDWLRGRSAEGSVAVNDLTLAGQHFQHVRGHLIWDESRLEFDGLQANVDRASVAGRLAVNLRGNRPAYKLTGRLKGLAWQSGNLDAQGTLETSGVGAQLLANLTSEGAISGAALDLGTSLTWRMSGSFSLAWPQTTPKLRLTALNLRTGDESYTGQGGTLENGRLVLLVSNGAKEMRISGLPGKLRVDEANDH
jgi:hypothetical protein